MLLAPVDIVWKAWTVPEHVSRWWGPAGFTTTVHEMNLREEGEWKLTLHGSDGKNYPNRSIFKEIIPFQKIVFEHFNPHFITTALFEEDGETTRLTWSLLFDTTEMREVVAKAHNAEEGQRQNIERLKDYLGLLLNTESHE
jgi:uncharacterized protein YndB with AHSA1/START domain